MRGSLESLERQNDRANAEGLERIEDEADLSDRIARGALVLVPVSAALEINPDLSEHHRYCRPWTARFLSDLARAHDAQFLQPINRRGPSRAPAGNNPAYPRICRHVGSTSEIFSVND